MKRTALLLFLTALAVGLCISSGFAQTARKANSAAAAKVISGGILNGKAKSLPMPAYPPAASAIGATGTVSVQVLIDEFGKVIDAKAVTGHPLLRAAAVEAAGKATFSPPPPGIPVKVSGVLIYNFVAPLTVARLSFVLTHALRTGRIGAYSSARSIANQLPADWTQEKELLNSITYAEHGQNISSDDAGKSEPTGDLSTGAKPSEPKRVSVKGDANSSPYAVRDMDERSRGTVCELVEIVGQRISNDDRSEWEFELGVAMAELVTALEDQSDTGGSIEKVREIVERVPAEVTPRSREQLSQFVATFDTIKVTDENRAEMASTAAALMNLRY
jgi:TonB family protein